MHARTLLRLSSLAGALALAAAGCGESLTVENSEAIGSVGGVIFEASPGLPPIDNAQVTVIAGSFSKTVATQGGGVFSVDEVPAGTVIVRISSPDHVDVFLRDELPAAAGNFPAKNASLSIGPIAIASNKGAFKVRVVDEGGAPVPGARVSARAYASYLDLAANPPASGGLVDVGAEVAADGLATIAGLPSYDLSGALLDDRLTVTVAPVVIEGSGAAYSSLGFQKDYSGVALFNDKTNTPTIVLAGPRTALGVLASNLDWLETGAAGATGSTVSAAGPITITFNQAVNPASLRAAIYTEYGALAPVTPTPEVSGNIVTVRFSGKTLDPGARYNLQIRAVAAQDQAKEYSAIAPFFTTPAAGAAVAIVPMATRIDPDNPNDLLVTFSEPIGLGSGSKASLPCVTFFAADLDGNSGVTSPGEYNQNGPAFLGCNPNASQAGFYLRPDEPVWGVRQSSPVTGFTTRWRITVRPFAATCHNDYQCCVAATNLHVVFSRNTDANTLVRRVTGQVVPDLVPFTLPAFSCP